MLAGLAAAPVVAPLAKLFPAETYTTYLMGKDAIVSYRCDYTMTLPPNMVMRFRDTPDTKIFRCGTGEMGTLWWSKEPS
jgi:hypothetical protein